MPPYDGWVSGMAVCPLCRGVASSEAEMSYLLEGGSLPSSEAEMSYRLEGGSLPSSEAEMICPLEGRFAILERGGDAGCGRGSRWEPSSEAEIVPRAREGCEWAACWSSLSPFLSSRLEGGHGPSWAWSP
jgi:hypothetical protein